MFLLGVLGVFTGGSADLRHARAATNSSLTKANSRKDGEQRGDGGESGEHGR
jgi:hypothetical protein